MKELRHIKLAFADDHPGVRMALSKLLELTGHFEVSIQADNGIEMLEKLNLADSLPDICIIDISMPVMSGYELLAQIRKQWPEIKTLIFTMVSGEYAVHNMIKRGAHGFLTKNSTADELASALLAIQKSGYYYSEIADSTIFDLIHNKTIRPKEINPQELKFIEHCARNIDYHQMAEDMNTTYRGVLGRRDRLFQKMKVSSRSELLLAAVHHGIIPIDFSNQNKTYK